MARFDLIFCPVILNKYINKIKLLLEHFTCPVLQFLHENMLDCIIFAWRPPYTIIHLVDNRDHHRNLHIPTTAWLQLKQLCICKYTVLKSIKYNLVDLIKKILEKAAGEHQEDELKMKEWSVSQPCWLWSWSNAVGEWDQRWAVPQSRPFSPPKKKRQQQTRKTTSCGGRTSMLDRRAWGSQTSQSDGSVRTSMTAGFSLNIVWPFDASD